jgi:hypothetical protein
VNPVATVMVEQARKLNRLALRTALIKTTDEL